MSNSCLSHPYKVSDESRVLAWIFWCALIILRHVFSNSGGHPLLVDDLQKRSCKASARYQPAISSLTARQWLSSSANVSQPARYFRTIVSCCRIIALLHYRIVLSHYREFALSHFALSHRTFALSYYRVVALSHRIVALSHYRIVFSHCRTIALSHYRVIASHFRRFALSAARR